MPSPSNALPVRDIHSYGNPELARVKHLNLDLNLVFERQIIEGVAVLTIERTATDSTQLVLDSRALHIHQAEVSSDAVTYEPARFSLGPSDKILGAPLAIDIEPNTKFIRIRYSTDPGATALQWLTEEQTAGKRHPFLYTQSQAIHARSWLPLQDSPGVRVTFEAKVRVPQGLKAVMGASSCPGVDGDFRFIMDRPVPSYLIALAAGDLSFQSTGPRTGVWAEFPVVEKAAAEFSDMEKMLEAGERLYGPYRWGRYDVLVLPPSFPFGGMENPCVTFATPTVIAGDRSLVSLVAHELAHSWSGNLVTNATWSDFWLNEGFTVYIERRILEVLYGSRRAEMEAALGYQDLQAELQSHPPPEQILCIDLAGRDPDDGVTSIPYEKGALFLCDLDRTFGRRKFDAWLKSYFDHFAFQSITTAQSLDYLREHLFAPDPGFAAKIPLHEWIFEPGLPASAPAPVFEPSAAGDSWTTQDLLHFLRTQPLQLDQDRMRSLDKTYGLTASGNSEILDQWLLMAIRNEYAPAWPRLEAFLIEVGRRKYVKPLYEALDRERALAIYEKARPGYHPITQTTIDAIIAAK
jgi:leukotriene-A4 hydrolase